MTINQPYSSLDLRSIVHHDLLLFICHAMAVCSCVRVPDTAPQLLALSETADPSQTTQNCRLVVTQFAVLSCHGAFHGDWNAVQGASGHHSVCDRPE